MVPLEISSLYGPLGGIILDSYAGTCTTGIAALHKNVVPYLKIWIQSVFSRLLSGFESCLLASSVNTEYQSQQFTSTQCLESTSMYLQQRIET